MGCTCWVEEPACDAFHSRLVDGNVWEVLGMECAVCVVTVSIYDRWELTRMTMSTG